MTVPQTRVLIHDYIDLDVQFVASVVCLNTLNLFDCLCETHRHVKKDIALVGCSRSACEVSDMRSGGTRPVKNDVAREYETAEGVKPPDLGVVSDCTYQYGSLVRGGGERTKREYDTECIEYNVCHRILSQSLDAGIPNEPAVEPAKEFDHDGRSHNSDGGDC